MRVLVNASVIIDQNMMFLIQILSLTLATHSAATTVPYSHSQGGASISGSRPDIRNQGRFCTQWHYYACTSTSAPTSLRTYCTLCWKGGRCGCFAQVLYLISLHSEDSRCGCFTHVQCFRVAQRCSFTLVKILSCQLLHQWKLSVCTSRRVSWRIQWNSPYNNTSYSCSHLLLQPATMIDVRLLNIQCEHLPNLSRRAIIAMTLPVSTARQYL